MIKQYSITINKGHHLFEMCDDYCHSSAIVYNRTIYYYKKIKQETGKYPAGKMLYDLVMKDHEDYNDINSKKLTELFGYFNITNGVLRDTIDILSFFWKAAERYKTNPELFKGKPHFPRYKDKITGRNKISLNCKYLTNDSKKKGLYNTSSSFIVTQDNKISLRGKFKNKLSIPSYLKDKNCPSRQLL